jgi:uncharacterized protein (DUF2235 family)
MAKNIVLCIDGTGNNGDEPLQPKTNVRKLYEACTDKKKCYIRGVGTGGKRDRILGGAGGLGTDQRLRAAYEFLVDDYSDGDSIFLFGFSRGAFAARTLAGFLGRFGTLFRWPLDKALLADAYRLYEFSIQLGNPEAFTRIVDQIARDTPRADGDERPVVRPIPIHFVGVWDTVARYLSAARDLPDIHYLPDHISYARHALALHERREEMEPELWTQWKDRPGRVQQVWFPGAHSDVGGGYPQSEAALSDAALRWMLAECESHGMNVDQRSVSWTGNPRKLHQAKSVREIAGKISRLGESPRLVLSRWPSERVLSSFFMHKESSDWLLNSYDYEDTSFHKWFSNRGKKNALKQLKEIDAQSLKLYVTLLSRFDRTGPVK